MDAAQQLQQALNANRKAKELYDAMPPSHQHEYIKLITDAKLSATKARRVEEAIVHILDASNRKALAGYSGTPLVQKLGIAPGINIVVHPPTGHDELLGLHTDVVLKRRLQPGANFVHAFYISKRRLTSDFEALKNSLRKDGQLWISWPKGSSKMERDLGENDVREVGLAHGLVDVKVAAIDKDWSGLKFVYRVKDR